MKKDFIKASERVFFEKETIKEKILKFIQKNKKVKYVKPRTVYKNITFI